jgi:hypothetical protein
MKQKTLKGILLASLSFYAVVHAHVDMIHAPTAHEIAEEQRREHQKEVDEAWKVYEDENASASDRYEAFEKLVENEEIL